MSVQEMRVKKRNGNFEDISFDKILNRVKKLGNNMKPVLKLNYSQFIMSVIDQLYPDISTTKIDELTAEQCASLCTTHPDYGILASRIIVSNNHKNTIASFSDTMEKLYNFKDIHNIHIPIIDVEIWNIIENRPNTR